MSIQAYWYRTSLHPLLAPLLPFSWAFSLVTHLRRLSYRLGLQKTQPFSVPVIVVGNITIGGTGKTPLVIDLVNYFKAQGKKPGIALRGVGGRKNYLPLRVTAESDPFEVGDEAVLLAKNTNCPVVACIDRPKAVSLLEKECDLILCDDGLQHYRLARQVEIAVIDGSRYFGNGHLLPAGPLREPIKRLQEVDFIIVNESEKNAAQTQAPLKTPRFRMQVKAKTFKALHEPRLTAELSHFSGQKVHALAGIGNPLRFFQLLTSLNIEVIPHIFPDHHRYSPEDLHFSDELPILMTEKDAIKCSKLPFEMAAKEKQWYLQITTEVSPEFKQALLNKI
jgi:tetraacyldisaccharide 4'-kinase